MDSKLLMKRALSGGETETVPVAPLVFSYAANLRGLEPREMLSETTLLANSLADAQALFGYDALVTWFDTTLEAEACGCAIDWSDGIPRVAPQPPAEAGPTPGIDPEGIETRGRVPVALEVARRLKKVVGREVTLLGAVTGPLTLFSQVAGSRYGEASLADPAAAARILELAGETATRMVRLYGEVGLDGLIVAEDVSALELMESLPAASGVYDQLFGIMRYFECCALFVSRNCPSDGFGRLTEELLCDCIAIGEGAEPASAVLKCREEDIVPAATVPVEALLAGPDDTADEVDRCLREAAGGAFVLTTSWEVPMAAPMESIRAMVNAR